MAVKIFHQEQKCQYLMVILKKAMVLPKSVYPLGTTNVDFTTMQLGVAEIFQLSLT